MAFSPGDKVKLKEASPPAAKGDCGHVRTMVGSSIIVRITKKADCSDYVLPFVIGPLPQNAFEACDCPD